MNSRPLRITGFEEIGLSAKESSDIVLFINKFVFLVAFSALERTYNGPKTRNSGSRIAVLVSASMLSALLPMFKNIYRVDIPEPKVSISLIVAI
ncbi:hypothetical protein AYI68_g3753 [Smittium mucronatum]|uniref:Uncharacterized protein n=1 Tax=Smittium mucronatum TaxID=133383 RepID=A0A1R0GYZ1_9FUNG|nr:hypothetical protein AYI68_g3753 [Smittium mucronatum]